MPGRQTDDRLEAQLPPSRIQLLHELPFQRCQIASYVPRTKTSTWLLSHDAASGAEVRIRPGAFHWLHPPLVLQVF